jgi:hypothetical protein
MDDQITNNKLDTILTILKTTTKNLGGIQLYLNDNNITGFDFDEIRRIVRKLIDVGYLRDFGNATYTVTFDGNIFIENGGYTAKALRDANESLSEQRETDRRRTLDALLAANSTTLNVLTKRLVIATWVAGILGVLILLWQIFQYLFPPHIDAVHVILQK